MLREFLRKACALRSLTVVLAITAMLSVSAASVSVAHTHLKEPVDRCNVCQTAHLATQQIIVVQIIHGPELQSLFAPQATIQRVDSRSVFTSLTRGPPSSL